jgi:FKBP12-rapamycin complex-associated protein
MARLYSGTSAIRRQIQQILAQVGRAHPQALIYPLAVASQYPNAYKRRAAVTLLNRLRDQSAKIVEQVRSHGRSRA